MPPKKRVKVNEQDSVDKDDGTKEKTTRGRKPSAAAKNTATTTTNNDGTIPKVLLNQTETEFSKQDFTKASTASNGNPWNLKIASWNVDGLRAWVKKGGLDYLKHENPDILCLQETKCSNSKLPKETTDVKGYHAYWCHSKNEGYAGVGLYSKAEPLSVSYGIGLEVFDTEGRLMVAEYENFHLVNVYVPNAGRKLVTLPKRMEWDPAFRRLVKELDDKKPVIICGDMNVAHEEIDIANPKSNKRNAGFTQEERDGFTTLLTSDDLIDCFRHKYPETKNAFTFWTYLANARKKNIGWRLDYCLLSRKLSSSFCDCLIRSDVFGSDHCPVVLFMHL